MSKLAKLTIKTVARTVTHDPTHQRRRKLLDALNVQSKVLAAALKGDVYQVKAQRWTTGDDGEKVATDRMRTIKPWFFEQDGGWYVQCRYGSKVLDLGKGNAVFAAKLGDVEAVLEALLIAVQDGELDSAIANALSKRKAPSKS